MNEVDSTVIEEHGRNRRYGFVFGCEFCAGKELEMVLEIKREFISESATNCTQGACGKA